MLVVHASCTQGGLNLTCLEYRQLIHISVLSAVTITTEYGQEAAASPFSKGSLYMSWTNNGD